MWPCDSARPEASNVNYVRGQTVPNAAVVRLGSDRRLCVYTQEATHVIVDLAGAFRGGAGAGLYDGAPDRLLDTREGGGGPVRSGQVVAVALGAGVAAAVLNVTVTAPTTSGYVTVYPCGGAVPTASNLNFVAGQTVANHVIVAVGGDQRVCVYLYGNPVAGGAQAHLVVDAFGVLSAASVTVPQLVT